MTLATLLRRVLILVLALALPAAAIGLALGRVRGLIAAEALLGVSLCVVVFRCEAGVLAAYRVQGSAPAGATRSLERVLAPLGGPTPRVRVFQHPSALALVARAPGAPGTILLSEGLLGILDESELRQLLTACVRRLRGRGMVFQTLCAWLAHLTLALAPRAWTEMWFGELREHPSLGPFDGLRFVASFSTARFLARLGRPQGASMATDAPRAYVHLSRWPAGLANPGTGLLHLADPWVHRSLLPL